MLIDPPPSLLELLVVGGLTVDRLADGSRVPGGSVIHIARAAAAHGLRVGVVTAAGPEPEARAGLAELRDLVAVLACHDAPASTTYRHRETPAGRRLWLETRGEAVELEAHAQSRMIANAILYAPIAGEVPPGPLRAWNEIWQRGAILQGWLRTSVVGAEVRPLPLAAMPDATVEPLRGFDLLVASCEDLSAEAADPLRQLAALRVTFGAAPTLVVTDGVEGVWISRAQIVAGDEPWHVPVPRRVDGAPTVGAGDVFAAFLLAGRWDRPPGREFLTRKAEAAMRVVAGMLDARLRS